KVSARRDRDLIVAGGKCDSSERLRFAESRAVPNRCITRVVLGSFPRAGALTLTNRLDDSVSQWDSGPAACTLLCKGDTRGLAFFLDPWLVKCPSHRKAILRQGLQPEGSGAERPFVQTPFQMADDRFERVAILVPDVFGIVLRRGAALTEVLVDFRYLI